MNVRGGMETLDRKTGSLPVTSLAWEKKTPLQKLGSLGIKMNKELETIPVYKSRLKWLFIAGFICGTIIGTAIIETWIRL